MSGQRQRRARAIRLGASHGDMVALPDDLKPKQIHGAQNPIQGRIDRKFCHG
jgi:hypothetical protein